MLDICNLFSHFSRVTFHFCPKSSDGLTHNMARWASLFNLETPTHLIHFTLGLFWVWRWADSPGLFRPLESILKPYLKLEKKKKNPIKIKMVMIMTIRFNYSSIQMIYSQYFHNTFITNFKVASCYGWTKK